MHIQTILNACQKFKSFLYKNAKLVNQGGKRCLEVTLIPRKNSRAICSGCGKQGSCYDHQGIFDLFKVESLVGYDWND